MLNRISCPSNLRQSSGIEQSRAGNGDGVDGHTHGHDSALVAVQLSTFLGLNCGLVELHELRREFGQVVGGLEW